MIEDSGRRDAPGVGKAAVVVAAGLVFFGAFELTTRLEDWVQYQVPLSSPYNATSTLLVRTVHGMHGRRNAAFQKWRMNSLGFRGPEVDSAKTPGRLRIITSGASETFGLYESAGKEWPRQLEDSLAERLAGRACARAGVEVWNAAFAGMSLPTIRQDIELRLARFEPDVVVVYPTPAFYLMGKLPVVADPDSAGNSEAVPTLWTPRAGPRIREQFKRLVPEGLASVLRRNRIARVRGVVGRHFGALPIDRVDSFAVELRRIGQAIDRGGAEPVLLTHANDFGFGTVRPFRPERLVAWQRFHPLADGPVLIALDSAARTRTIELADSAGWHVADVAELLARSPRQVFADYAHFNDYGAALAAGVAAEAVTLALRNRCTAQIEE